ncbi:MAG: c-type cytochrome, partial [Verrucomicrobiota bacterium]
VMRTGENAKAVIERIKELAIAKLSDAERGALGPILENKPTAQPLLPAGPVRDFQKAWSIAELTVDIEKDGKKERNFARGREIYVSLQCAQCHRFGEFGGNVGPDLSAVGNRFNRHDLLESIIDPSKVISEQYASALVTTTAGETLFGYPRRSKTTPRA